MLVVSHQCANFQINSFLFNRFDLLSVVDSICWLHCCVNGNKNIAIEFTLPLNAYNFSTDAHSIELTRFSLHFSIDFFAPFQPIDFWLTFIRQWTRTRAVFFLLLLLLLAVTSVRWIRNKKQKQKLHNASHNLRRQSKHTM